MQDVLCTVSASDGVFQLSLTKFVELKGAPCTTSASQRQFFICQANETLIAMLFTHFFITVFVMQAVTCANMTITLSPSEVHVLHDCAVVSDAHNRRRRKGSWYRNQQCQRAW